MPVLIAGLGTAVPPHRIAQPDAAAIARQYSCETPDHERVFNAVYWGSGVETRHSVVLKSSKSNGDECPRQTFYGDTSPTTRDRMEKYESEAGDLAVAASHRALADAQLAPESLTHLITVSCTGFYAPGFDFALIKQLELHAGIARTHVGFMGCHGALNALRVAQAFVAADPAARVLVCAVEMCSLHHQYGWNAEKVVANALFADGAGAVVVIGGRAPSHDRHQMVASGSTMIPDSADAMSWRIGDRGFEMTLSARVPGLIAANLRPWLDSWLKVHGLTISEIGSWAVHPGGPRILAAVGESLEIDRHALGASHSILTEYGNMSSPTVLFILERIRNARGRRPCVALGFGPGLAVEALLLA
jgi:predicted naringenin-chalcone synthase